VAEAPASPTPADEAGPSIPVYDLRGLKCPLPVLRARKRLAAMAPGMRLWIETTDPLAVIDIPAFLAEDGHALVERQTVADGHRFLVRRG
jgi:tRNA 2-thiouridine synthesizing protein A